jgi:hypothetical protein
MSSRLIKGWKGIREKWVLGKVESLDKLQEELIKKVKRERPLGGVTKKYREKDLG